MSSRTARALTVLASSAALVLTGAAGAQAERHPSGHQAPGRASQATAAAWAHQATALRSWFARHGKPGSHHADPHDAFVQRAGNRLTLQGRTYRFGGTNNYYLEYSDPVMTDDVLETAADRGLDVVRAWAFLDVPSATDHGDKGAYFQYWDAAAGKPAFNDGADGLERLDYVIAKAAQEGLRLVLPLTNNWSDFGGMDQYTSWAGNAYHSDFYTDARERTWFKSWISHLLNRTNTITGVKYKDDPTIMAWELANEPRCGGSGGKATDPSCTVRTLDSWVGEMSSYVKSIDRRHLVGTGDEGFTATDPTGGDWTTDGSQGVDSTLFAEHRSVDYMSYHLYPDSWGKTAEWGTAYIRAHSKSAKKIGKPAILGEFGSKDPATRNTVYRDWTDAVRTSGGAGGLFWILSGVQADGTTLYPDYDGFTEYASSPSLTTLANFATSMRTGRTSFAPVADDDTVSTAFATPVSVDATANDIAYRARVLDRTLDLDPAAPGRQTSLAATGGTFTAADDGTVTFAPADGFSGRATATYRVLDSRGRTSGTATITVKVAPSPTAPQVLFDFSDGPQGWAPMHGADGGTVATSDGALDVKSLGDWFGTSFSAPVDLSARTTLTFTSVATTGFSPILALQVGDAWTWCQASPLSWTTATGTLAFDLTTLDAACTAGLGQVHSVELYLNGGTHRIDDVTVS
ncbi:MAG TPA: cellulase family glycosylhydrolase [Luteimicrobium sp.]|nr:cellulase family glycosylhydrolase [Luteimicrobium sp.]